MTERGKVYLSSNKPKRKMPSNEINVLETYRMCFWSEHRIRKSCFANHIYENREAGYSKVEKTTKITKKKIQKITVFNVKTLLSRETVEDVFILKVSLI